MYTTSAMRTLLGSVSNSILSHDEDKINYNYIVETKGDPLKSLPCLLKLSISYKTFQVVWEMCMQYVYSPSSAVIVCSDLPGAMNQSKDKMTKD
jgi:hypothetical protein